MTATITQQSSPLANSQGASSVVTKSSARRLSVRDHAALLQIIEAEKYDFVESDLFRKRNAQRLIFDEAPEITKPDVSWYHPLLENAASLRKAKQVKTVILTSPQEQALFIQYNYCRFMVAKLKKQAGTRTVPLKLARDILQWHYRAEAFREQIANTNLALVLAMAKRTRMSDVDFGDLISEGNMALLRATDKFDAARGFKFSTYACRAILKAFSRAGVKLSKYRQLFPTDFDPKLEKSDFMDRKRADHEYDCADEVHVILTENRASLTDIERQVIEDRFALGEKRRVEPEASPMTLEQVGKIIGVTKERVRQIQNKALVKIRSSLEEGYLS